jgi:hypothetical protein
VSQELLGDVNCWMSWSVLTNWTALRRGVPHPLTPPPRTGPHHADNSGENNRKQGRTTLHKQSIRTEGSSVRITCLLYCMRYRGECVPYFITQRHYFLIDANCGSLRIFFLQLKPKLSVKQARERGRDIMRTPQRPLRLSVDQSRLFRCCPAANGLFSVVHGGKHRWRGLLLFGLYCRVTEQLSSAHPHQKFSCFSASC